MSINIEFKYSIGETVKINGLDWEGRVIALFVGRKWIEYQVRYVFNGKYEEIYFCEDELTLCPSDRKDG